MKNKIKIAWNGIESSEESTAAHIRALIRNRELVLLMIMHPNMCQDDDVCRAGRYTAHYALILLKWYTLSQITEFETLHILGN